ncbi:MAG: hypothetical protein KGL39_29820 [Patescibacteria group bacterium]|nr:hypothetical protein [Patescibacteria group bacterium]
MIGLDVIGVEILIGTVSMIIGLIYGARWIGAATERHVGVGLLTFIAVLAALIGSVWLYGWAVRSWR